MFPQVKALKGIAATAFAAVAVALAGVATGADYQRPSTDGHVGELARYLIRVQIAEPVTYSRLAVYPVVVSPSADLPGHWLTLDAAISRGVLVVTEKGSASVPHVIVENRSRDEYVFIMGGEVISGGKQTRTVRNDVVLAPGEHVELDVYCVEAHRWHGEEKFASARVLVPQSIQQELRKGTDQEKVWDEIARNNAALGAENATGSLELALKSRDVQDKLSEVRRRIVPNVPDGTSGFIFADGDRALGAELFGDEQLAREMLPKLLASYAVDCVVIERKEAGDVRHNHRTAIDFFERVCRGESHRGNTPGSGSGIRTNRGGLVGDGVSLRNDLVHYGVQPEQRIVWPRPEPRPTPRRIRPENR